MCVNCGCSSCNTNSYVPDNTSALKYDGSKFVCPTDFTVLPGASLNDMLNTLMEQICTNASSVDSVTGLDTDNTDPENPIVQIAVDGVTITGEGTPASPLVSVGGGGGGGNVTGTGTTNYVTKWTGANTLSTTSLLYDSSTFVGVNATTQLNAETLRVNGGFTADESVGGGNFTVNNGNVYLSNSMASNKLQIQTTAPGAASATLELIGGASLGSYGRISYGLTGGLSSLEIYNKLTSSTVVDFTTGDDIGIGITGPIDEKVHIEGRIKLNNQAGVPGFYVGGGTIYVEGGALKYIGSSGTVTTLGVA